MKSKMNCQSLNLKCNLSSSGVHNCRAIDTDAALGAAMVLMFLAVMLRIYGYG